MADWFNCYKPYPKDAVVPESFTHPAKMGWDLCHRIFDRLEALGLERGSKILDPFCGIGTTLLVGGLRGYWVSGMELEPRFCDLATKNILKNKFKLAAWPEIKQGDSRKDLLSVFGGEKFAAVVGSPDFAGVGTGGKNNVIGRNCQTVSKNRPVEVNKTKGGEIRGLEYGQSSGQMANLPEGDFNAVIGSPPYSETEITTDKNSMNPKWKNRDLGYGKSGSQIGNLPEGDFSAVVSSPPYEEGLGHGGNPTEIDKKKKLHNVGSIQRKEYRFESGETYWSACRDIYAACYLLLKPGGFIALVVKDFVRRKQRVPLCDQTWELLQAVGFEPIERNRAWLVEERQAATFFEANYSVKKERKSFFRRLAEKKGSPKIDFEEVLIARKANP